MTGAMRQIVAFGGGGFSMESGNPLLDDYVLGLTGTAIRGSASCRPRAATPTTTSCASTAPSAIAARPAHISPLPAGAGRPGHPLAPARPGPDLRRRRQPDQPARRLARARHRRDPARGLRGRRDPLRPLAPARSAGSPRRSPASTARSTGVEGLGLLPLQQRGPLRRRSSRRGAFHRYLLRRDAGRATPPRTAPRCTSSATSWSRSSPPAPRRAATGSSGEGARCSRRGSPPGTWATRGPGPRRRLRRVRRGDAPPRQRRRPR